MVRFATVRSHSFATRPAAQMPPLSRVALERGPRALCAVVDDLARPEGVG